MICHEKQAKYFAFNLYHNLNHAKKDEIAVKAMEWPMGYNMVRPDP